MILSPQDIGKLKFAVETFIAIEKVRNARLQIGPTPENIKREVMKSRRKFVADCYKILRKLRREKLG